MSLKFRFTNLTDIHTVFFFKPFIDLRLIPICHFDYFLQSHYTLVLLLFIFIIDWDKTAITISCKDTLYDILHLDLHQLCNVVLLGY